MRVLRIARLPVLRSRAPWPRRVRDVRRAGNTHQQIHRQQFDGRADLGGLGTEPGGVSIPRKDAAMSDLDLIIRPKPVTRTEVCRSFSFKVNRGNYESSDYFCSQKAECAVEDQAEVSTALYLFCKTQVMKAVRQDLEEGRRGAA